MNIIQNIKELAAPLAEEREMFVVDVEIKTGGGQTEVWVYVDAEEQGVNLDGCAEISNELGLLVEAHEIFDKKYRLNVSSPGLSRPLTDRRQYPKNLGRVASVKFKDDGEYIKLEGVITGMDDDQLILTDEEEQDTQIAFDAIVETKIIPVI